MARSTNRIGCVSILLLLFSHFAPEVEGAFSYVTAQRSVSASVAGGPCPGSSASQLSNATSGVFNQSASAMLPNCFPLPQHATGTANQNTTLLGNGFFGQGDVSYFWDDGGSATASSLFDITFNLTSPAAYTLTGTVTGFFHGVPGGGQWENPSNAQVQLLQGTTVIHDFVQPLTNPNPPSPWPPGPFSVSGTLQAGTYQFLATVSQSAGGSVNGEGQFQFNMQIPEPGLGLTGSLVALVACCARRRTTKS